MSRSKKNSWKLLVLIALVSSFIFCSEVCAVQKEEKKAVCTKQKDEKKVPKEEQKCENKAAKSEQIGNQLEKNIQLIPKSPP